jgi:chemotaxis protein histidine kinase CheA
MSRLVHGLSRGGECVMSDFFADRMAELRERFAAQFGSRIDGIEAAMHPLEDDDLDDLAQAHRDAHHLCGIGATLGFVGTGTVARSIEQILLAAIKAGRPLTDEEVPRLRAGIALLRATALVELRSAH